MKESLAEKITTVIGSWKFLISQTLFLLVYVCYNLLAPNPFDPFPFIFLNLILSFQAAYTAPVILMSHSLMNERDRQLAAQDRENTRLILNHIKNLEARMIKEVDEAVDEITEAIEEADSDETTVPKT